LCSFALYKRKCQGNNEKRPVYGEPFSTFGNVENALLVTDEVNKFKQCVTICFCFSEQVKQNGLESENQGNS
jgi:hypothetical protein